MTLPRNLVRAALPTTVQAMVAVVTAVVAALFAGAVALYRERRLELQRFLVGARVVRALFLDAARSMHVLARPDDDGVAWSVVDAFADMLDFPNVWDKHRDVLAEGLSRAEWERVARGARSYVVTTADLTDRENTVPSQVGELFGTCERDLISGASILDPYCDHAGLFRNPGHRTHNANPTEGTTSSADPRIASG